MNSSQNIKKLALEYLVNAYGPDKLNDPAESEPIVEQMIALEPNEPTNYFALAKIYEDSGDYERAEATYLKAKEVQPNEPAVYTTLAGYYNRQGDFEKTIDALHQRTEKEPNNPEAHYMVATFYWDKVYRDFRLPDAEKKQFVQAGIEEVDKAIALKDDYVEAITYKNLLLRLQANLEKDPSRQQALLREADRLRDQALELRKKQQSGA
jgi:tetratricopeptide (TPR) repeat protein